MNRWILAFVLAMCILIMLALIGYSYNRWDYVEQKPGVVDWMLASAQSQTVDLGPCMDESTRERMRAVMLEALDDALKDHVKHVFEVWLKDDRGQPERARTGVRNGVRAWLGAHRSALDWMPPPCSG